jgi:hypothetical protein
MGKISSTARAILSLARQPKHIGEVAAMASIGPVTLEIFLNNPSEGMALVQVGYVVTQTMDDARSGRNYRELVQLVSKAQPIERLVPGGTVSDSILVFDSNHMAFNRNCALILPVASLEQGIVSPFQRDPILARVTLTPLPATASTQESNTVLVNQPPTLG